jgi:DNA (cytosine-5)-methyltransferase 1
MHFVDLFAGTGAFHNALRDLGHECVFASEVDADLRACYAANFPEIGDRLVGDIRENHHLVPRHDILCAGFPCQPFSKSGFQHGLRDATRGTLFHEIIEILRVHEPRYVLLENVGNFAKHDEGRTWAIVRSELESLGYDVRGTEHIAEGGSGLLSPHHFGYPHHRERFFILASRDAFARDPFVRGSRTMATNLDTIAVPADELTDSERIETRLTVQQIACIEHWNRLLRLLPDNEPLPSFPIWGDELDATYPFDPVTPYHLWNERQATGEPVEPLADYLATLPSYAREKAMEFPEWKRRFLRQNRDWFCEVRRHLTDEWVAALKEFPPSLRKLEWNCQGEDRDLWNCILQFRPSGLRAKRYTAVPALVSMTTTQIPILGPSRRFLTRREGLRLQGLPDDHRLPRSLARAFAALGNGVHAGLLRRIAERFLDPSTYLIPPADDGLRHIRAA